MNRNHSLIGLVVVLTVTLLLSVGGVIAQEQGPQSPQSAIGTAFTYQGQIKNANRPINDNCDFQFSVWNDDSGGTSLASDPHHTHVPVSKGLFTAQLDFGVNVFDGEARWLEIAVRCPAGSGEYATLTPRQPLTPAPYALFSTSTGALHGRSITTTTPISGQVLKWDGSVWSPAADAIGMPGSGDITGVYAGSGLTGGGASGEVTLTAAFGGSGSAATVSRSDHNHSGVYALVAHAHSGADITSGTINRTYIDPLIARDSEITPTVWLNDGTGSGLDADLLDGQHATNFAVTTHDHWGQSWSGSGTGLTLSGGAAGLAGSGSNYGVYGYSSINYGIYGMGAIGVHGGGTGTGVSGSGTNYGVFGYGNGSNSTGVFGSGNSIGVQGSASNDISSTGVVGSGITGVAGTGSGVGTTYGVSGTGSIGVQGSGDDYGVVGTSSGSYSTGVSGTGHTGVSGTGSGSNSRGVSGTGHAGLVGTGDGSTGNYGVYGDGFFGVWGEGDGAGSIGVSGYGNSTGVSGRGYIGVYGVTNNNGYGGYFQGNVYIEGSLIATGGKSAVVETQAYGPRALYAVESPEHWFEDFGTGQLLNGQAIITIEPVFAKTVNLTDAYHVFLTPLGDCALYVKEKSPSSFSVRTIGGQTCSIAFDYRIVAKRLGYEDVRLAEVNTPPIADPPSGGK
ncbi:hypothetical protein TFLX_01500 [Thermoflexales bacterium]|nr:hypothetical protein TFLX_01500 [Thermoflexales bacterium]